MVRYDNIFIVYSMGKVASTSVFAALKQQVPTNSYVAHSHFLNIPKLLQRVRENAKNPALMDFLKQAFEVHKVIRENPSASITWISLVRDPVARELSNILENPWIIGRKKWETIDDSALKLALSYLSRKTSYHYVLSWFDDEFFCVTRQDIFQWPFEQHQGFSVACNPYRNERYILVQVERLSALSCATWRELVGHELTIGQSNQSSAKAEVADGLHKALQASLVLNKQVEAFVYESRFMKHFYLPSDIDGFKKRWAG
jgi:hypothetical protein